MFLPSHLQVSILLVSSFIYHYYTDLILQIAKDAIIQIWLGGGKEILKALDQGYRVLFSSCWYLDHSKYGIHWTDYYLCDPTHHNISKI